MTPKEKEDLVYDLFLSITSYVESAIESYIKGYSYGLSTQEQALKESIVNFVDKIPTKEEW